MELLKTAGDWVLVSYADPHQDHVGYVYQSSNWRYTGRSTAEPAWLHPETGELVSNTRRHIDRKAKAIGLKWTDLVKDPRPGKHRYVSFAGTKPMVKKMKADLLYESMPYPKG